MWALISRVALSIALSIGLITFAPGILAQPHALGEPQLSAHTYNTTISEFESKLEVARRMQGDLNHRVACLNKEADELVSLRNVKELELGQLHTLEQQLKGTVDEQQAAYDGYRTSLEVEERKLHALRANLRELQLRRDEQRLWIEQCKREKDWKRLWGLTCEADMNIAQTFGAIKNYEGDIAGAERRMQIARDSVEVATQNLEKSKGRLIMAGDKVKAIREESSRTERDIAVLMASLSDIRVVMQPFQIEIDEYANALNEARDVSVVDKRPRAVRKLSDISEKIDASIKRSSDAILKTDRKLGVGWMKACIN
jgi:hypothetical protein